MKRRRAAVAGRDFQVGTVGPERLVDVTALDRPLKRKAWSMLQERKPALAELLQRQDTQELIKAFDAHVMVDAEVLDGLGG